LLPALLRGSQEGLRDNAAALVKKLALALEHFLFEHQLIAWISNVSRDPLPSGAKPDMPKLNESVCARKFDC